MKLSVFSLSVLFLLSGVDAQIDPAVPDNMPPAGHGLPGSAPGTEQWLVQFKRRSFDLSRFRQAMYANRPWAEVEPILAEYRARTTADQAPFQEAIARLGGRVYIQYWIVNAAAIEIPHRQLAEVRKLPNVLRVDPNLPCTPAIRAATAAPNHNSDAVNQLGFKGKGIATAIVDTGLDGQCGNKNRPHQTFFEDGDLSKRNRLLANIQVGRLSAENTHPHGTGVAGIVAGGNWGSAGADHGHAPHADFVGYSLSHTSNGNTDHATQGLAWQWVARDAAKYNIKTANNSYHGSPDPLNVSQQALDAAAFNADVMIVVAAGNTSGTTTSSISCANGLAVAAVAAGSHAVASFSARGPLSSDTRRFYPDIAACGVGTVMPRNDTTGADYVASGTSMASPQVCGAATLLRAQVPTLKADQTKAILLASALDISRNNQAAPYNSRNAYGLGLLKDDAAMRLALDSSAHGRAAVTTASSTWQQSVTVKAGQSYRAVISWMRQTMTSTAWSNLDIEILAGTTVLASSTTPRNLYEAALFRATANGTLTFRVKGLSIENGKQEFGWAFTEGSTPPVQAEYAAFGSGCDSGSFGCTPCVSINWNQQLLNRTTTASKIGVLVSQSQIRVCGMDLYMAARTAPVDVTVALQEFNSTQFNVPGKVLASGKVRVGTSAGVYHVNWASPVQFGSGGVFYLTFDNADKLILPASSTGLVQAHVEFGTAWSTIKVDTNWQYRVHCDQGMRPPVLLGNGTPVIGKSMQVGLRDAPRSAPTMFLIGLSNSSWGGNGLPLTYAPNCQLLVSPDHPMAMATDANGGASVTLAIPSRKDLIGVVFFNQYLVSDSVNAIGVISSNGGRGLIGEF